MLGEGKVKKTRAGNEEVKKKEEQQIRRREDKNIIFSPGRFSTQGTIVQMLLLPLVNRLIYCNICWLVTKLNISF